eukprot:TRINITY_DN19348_c0_g1_i1.p1 TRINITY_DN19348_c0_g1~~TRINITY_DN19348_c0_g1_i1.p1  ORF type:complete len:189 (-),score=36.73 TRINITY_DN19348_c0_g1_i1:146-712(-)
MKLIVESKRADASSEYSRENFSYGTTPYNSWRQLFELPCLQEEIEVLKETDREYTVFGSSAGWLVFYGGLSFNLPAVGVELMGFLVDEANEAARECELTEQVQFVHQDMLCYDLSKSGIVMLTSQCWDAELIDRVCLKLATDLSPGSLVVDYRSELSTLQVDHFEMIECVKVPVSWNENQSFWVFRKK